MNLPSPSHPLSKRATSALCLRRPRLPRRPPTPSRCVGQVSGVNFYGELGIGKRTPVYMPALHKYWKLGDALYDQAVGGGRGFKNLSLVVFGFEHGFGMDEQGVLYAWGRNAYGQLGIQSREFPEGSRYHSLWPQPLPFFRPARLRLCSAGLDYLRACTTSEDCFQSVGLDVQCVPGLHPAAPRRNAWSASKMPMDPAFSAVPYPPTPPHAAFPLRVPLPYQRARPAGRSSQTCSRRRASSTRCSWTGRRRRRTRQRTAPRAASSSCGAST